MVKLRISPGKNGRVRGRGERNVRISVGENHSLLRHRIQVRSQSAFRSEKSHAIGASGVQRDQDDVGILRHTPARRSLRTLGGQRWSNREQKKRQEG